MKGIWKSAAPVSAVLVAFGLKLPGNPHVVYGQTTPPSCTDSDGGLNYEVSGFVTGISALGNPYTRYDTCTTAVALKEWYCSGTSFLPKSTTCPSGCSGGACQPLTCTDQDNDDYAIEGGACGPADCDDGNAAVNPGASEVCNNSIDDDCDGFADGADSECTTCTDVDSDGYAIEGGGCGPVDCNDANPNVNPGASEVCSNSIDDDCDNLVDAQDPQCPSCTDSDGGLNYAVSGYVTGVNVRGLTYTSYDTCGAGSLAGYVKEWYCSGITPYPKSYACLFGCAGGACQAWSDVCTDADGDGFAVQGGLCGVVDCDDTNPAVNPNASEVCGNGIDDDCNGMTDGQEPQCAACTDADSDGYSTEGGACGLADCNDADPSVHPGAFVDCDNGMDDDCDGLTDAQDPYCSASDLNIIVVGWDGLQRDHFWQCYNAELPECPDGLPNIAALSGGFAWDNTTTNGETSTKPGWAQLFTGYNAETMGVFTLQDYQPIPLGYTVFEKIENHFGADHVVTMFISAKGIHTGGACVGDWTFKNGVPVIEELGQPWCLTKDYLDYYELDQVTNPAVGNRALALLETHRDDPFFALFLFRDPDVTGHLYGENSVQYSQQIIEVDGWLGQIVAKLQELGIDEQTLVYVVTDHGFDEGKSYHMNAPYGILATNDPLVMRDGDRKDLAPTFLDRYGISVGELGGAPAVEGASLYAVPAVPCIAEGQAYLDYPGAPACCSGLELISLDIKYGQQCVIATGGTGDSSGYCTACGNGVCQAPENKCNCPVDCSSY